MATQAITLSNDARRALYVLINHARETGFSSYALSRLPMSRRRAIKACQQIGSLSLPTRTRRKYV